MSSVVPASCCATCVPFPAGSVEAAGRIPQSWTPCGTDMVITASSPSGAGTGHISVGLRVLVNIIGRWCVKLTVLVRTLKATSQIKLEDRRPCLLLLLQECHIVWGQGGFSSSARKQSAQIWKTMEWKKWVFAVLSPEEVQWLLL